MFFYNLILLIIFTSCSTLPDNVFLNPKVFGGDKTDTIISDTTNKITKKDLKRSWFFKNDKITFNNKYSGAKASKITKVGTNHYKVLSIMENAPINDSPWYSFSIKTTSRKIKQIKITLTYPKEGTHRYHPKVSYNKKDWKKVENYHYNNKANEFSFNVEASNRELYISAQELITSNDAIDWSKKTSNQYKSLKYSSLSTLKSSKTIPMLTHLSHHTSNKTIVIIGRQHPPEVTGSIALRSFVSQLFSPSDLSKKFLDNYNVYVFPMMNPDGVDNGNWRHNSNGVDLNRDWLNPNQQEIKDFQHFFLTKDKLNISFFIDFHSTTKNIFYLADTGNLKDNKLTLDIISNHAENYPNENFEIARLSSKVYKGSSFPWFYNQFQTPGVGYETKDDIDRKKLKEQSASMAKTFMKRLIKDI